MMRIRTIKQKKAKEIKSNVKEIKSKTKQQEDEDESDFDSGFEGSSSFSGNGKRAAPTLNNNESSSPSPLENTAATAPTKSATDEENNKKLYEGNYAGSGDYTGKKYTILSESNMQNAFDDKARMTDLFEKRRQQAMPGQTADIRETWQQQSEGGAGPEKKYEADIDTMKSSTKRRRMG